MALPIYQQDAEALDRPLPGLLSEEADPHLRSVVAVTRCRVHATGGRIGRVENVLVDDATWASAT